MRSMSPLARLYIWTVLLLGGLTVLGSGPSLPEDEATWLAFVVLTVSAATAQALPVVTPKNQSYELTSIFVFAGILLLPPGALTLLVVLAFIPEWIRSRKPWYIQLFNIAIYLVQTVAARDLYLWVAGVPTLFTAAIHDLVGALLGALLFTGINHLLLATVLHLARGHSWQDTRLFELEYFITDATLACTGVITALLWDVSPWLSTLIAGPLFLIYRALNTPNLQEEARTDPKTDLYNAKHFERVLREEFRRAVRFERPLAVIMADLDFLREINNRYGHIAGDVVIREVALILKRGLREYDVAARFGGEEFVLLLPETETAEAVAVAERLRRLVEEARFAITTSVEPIGVTLSLGVASLPADGSTPDEILQLADLAVYHAKLSGRNLVSVSPIQREASARNGAPGMAVSGGGVGRSAGVGNSETARGRLEPMAVEEEDRKVAPMPPPSSHGPGGAGDPAAMESKQSFTRQGGGARLYGWARSRSSDLGWPVALFVAGVVAAAAAVWMVTRPWEGRIDWPGLGALALLAVGAQSLAVEIYGRGRISTSAVILLAGGILFGMPGALLLAPLVPLTGWVQNRGLLHRAVFDLGDITLSSAVAVVVYGAFSALMPRPDPIFLLMPAAVAALAYYAVNVGLISVAIGLSEGRGPMDVWNEKFRWLPLHYLVFGPMALLITVAYHSTGIYGLLSLFVPAVMLRYVMKQYIDRTEANVTELKRVNEELVRTHEEVSSALKDLRISYDATLAALSAALDSRDAETEGHCQQVVHYAAAIAGELGLPEQEIAHLLNGALLHDVGKIGVPDAILNKRGPLTDEEWKVMRKHPELGYHMLQHIPFLRGALPVVRYHHERFDGGGYPNGKRGEEIPLGARIFAVADAFHAMTSNRPYRTALPAEAARRMIALGAGTQFDPKVVEAFMRATSAGGSRATRELVSRVAAVEPTEGRNGHEVSDLPFRTPSVA